MGWAALLLLVHSLPKIILGYVLTYEDLNSLHTKHNTRYEKTFKELKSLNMQDVHEKICFSLEKKSTFEIHWRFLGVIHRRGMGCIGFWKKHNFSWTHCTKHAVFLSNMSVWKNKPDFQRSPSINLKSFTNLYIWKLLCPASMATLIGPIWDTARARSISLPLLINQR